MQSSYNVIKNKQIIEQGHKEIQTELIKSATTPEVSANQLESYEQLAKNILENARREREKILATTYAEAQEIERQAYEQGYQKGQEEGYQAAYEAAYGQAKMEAEGLIAKAQEILQNTKIEYSQYLQRKEEDIRTLIFDITQAILKREVQAPTALNEMILDALEKERNAKSLVLRCHSTYKEAILSELEHWKQQLALKGEIFVIEDPLMEDGAVVIEKENGKVVLDIAYALEKIKELFKEE